MKKENINKKADLIGVNNIAPLSSNIKLKTS